MAGSGRGRSFLLAMSLAELGFILLFMVLLLSFVRMDEQEEELEEITKVLVLLDVIEASAPNTREPLEIDPDRVAEIVNLVEAGREYDEFKATIIEDPELPDDWQELVATTKQLIAEKKELESQLLEAEQLAEELSGASERDLAAKNAQLKKWLRAASDKVKRLEKKLEDCQAGLSDAAKCPSELETAKSEAEEILRQLNYMKKRAGFGHPPCWVDSQDRPDNLYEIRMEEETFSISGNWPAAREEAAKEEIFQAAIGESLSVRETRTRLKPILEWSKKQTPECRHFVVLDDCAPSAGPQNRRLLVEDYFYKSKEYFRCADESALDED